MQAMLAKNGFKVLVLRVVLVLHLIYIQWKAASECSSIAFIFLLFKLQNNNDPIDGSDLFRRTTWNYLYSGCFGRESIYADHENEPTRRKPYTSWLFPEDKNNRLLSRKHYNMVMLRCCIVLSIGG